jgi:hypothetical protein
MKKNKNNNRSKQNRNKPITKQQVRSMIKADKQALIKYTDTIITVTTLSSSNTYTNIGMPTVGNGQNNRQANTIEIDHFDIRLTEGFDDVVTTSADIGFDRFILFQNIGEGLINAPADLLDQTTTSLNLINSPISYSNNNNLFHILWDVTQKVDTFNPTCVINRKSRPSLRKLRYNAIDSVWSTGVPCLAIHRWSGGLTGGSVWTAQVIVRMWFYDV